MSLSRKLPLVAAILMGALCIVPSVHAAQTFVVQLSYQNRWGRAFDVHFAPIGGFGKGQCEQSLPMAIAEYGPDLKAAFRRNFGSEVESFNTAQFVDGTCRGFDFPPGQTFDLKLPGQ